jgi:hypothetical protein
LTSEEIVSIQYELKVAKLRVEYWKAKYERSSHHTNPWYDPEGEKASDLALTKARQELESLNEKP